MRVVFSVDFDRGHWNGPLGGSRLGLCKGGTATPAGLVAMLRSLSALIGGAPSWGVLLIAFGALNMLAGNLMALRQTQVKRLLAYSSLSHVGYMLLGLGIAIYAGEAAGAQGGLFHLFNHGLMKGLAAGASWETCGRLGSVAATYALEHLGGSSHRYSRDEFKARYESHFGPLLI